MIPNPVLITACIFSACAALVIPWIVLAIIELRQKNKIHEFYLQLCLYQDAAFLTYSKEKPTPEEEFSLTLMQEKLKAKASDLHLEFTPFERPQGI